MILIVFFLQSYQQKHAPLQGEMDNVNDLANELQAADIILSHFSVRRLEDFNTRSVSVGVFFGHGGGGGSCCKQN